MQLPPSALGRLFIYVMLCAFAGACSCFVFVFVFVLSLDTYDDSRRRRAYTPGTAKTSTRCLHNNSIVMVYGRGRCDLSISIFFVYVAKHTREVQKVTIWHGIKWYSSAVRNGAIRYGLVSSYGTVRYGWLSWHDIVLYGAGVVIDCLVCVFLLCFVFSVFISSSFSSLSAVLFINTSKSCINSVFFNPQALFSGTRVL